MSTTERHRKVVDPSPQFAQAWRDLRKAVDEAAAQFTGGALMPMSPFQAHLLTGADRELAAALAVSKRQTVEAAFFQSAPGEIKIELAWWDDKP